MYTSMVNNMCLYGGLKQWVTPYNVMYYMNNYLNINYEGFSTIYDLSSLSLNQDIQYSSLFKFDKIFFNATGKYDPKNLLKYNGYLSLPPLESLINETVDGIEKLINNKSIILLLINVIDWPDAGFIERLMRLSQYNFQLRSRNFYSFDNMNRYILSGVNSRIFIINTKYNFSLDKYKEISSNITYEYGKELSDE